MHFAGFGIAILAFCHFLNISLCISLWHGLHLTEEGLARVQLIAFDSQEDLSCF